MSGQAAGELCPKCLLVTALEEETAASSTQTVAAGPSLSRGLPHPGEQLGHYSVERMLGHGGMGAVYEALDLENGRRVALKVLSHSLEDPNARQRFLREGRLAASINHPNSVYVFGTEEIAGTPVIAMELMPGGTLQDRVQRVGPLPSAEAVDAVLQIIAGLEAAHLVGILHRDIKPSNCFIGEGMNVKIGDFGLSISTSLRIEPAITASGAFLGTPAFCSPEQLRGEELNTRSDMYSVGATLFFLLTGRTAFECRNMVQMLATILEQKPPSPKQFRPGIPEGLARVVLRCLEKQPSERFRSYSELRQALAPYSSASPTPATLGLRFAAGLADQLLLGLLGAIAGSVSLYSFDFLELAAQNSPRALPFIAGWLALVILYYCLFETYRGATPGKALFRLRVVGPDRSLPGLRQALTRASIYTIAPVLPFWLLQLVVPGGYAALGQLAQTLAGLSFYIILGLLFCTARRHNGFAAVHDLASGTRVVSRMALLSRPALPADSPPPVSLNTQPSLGPYHILEPLGSAGPTGEWFIGYDLRLLRKVWLRRAMPGEPPVPGHLRNLGRSGRLRWLAGRRGTGENWDAYEALTGRALPVLLKQPQPWAKVRFWLHDLAVELSAAGRDGTLPEVLDIDRVWITEDGRARLLDFPAPGMKQITPCEPFAPEANPICFLHQIAHAALTGSPVLPTTISPIRLPLHAQEFLSALPALNEPEAVVSRLSSLLQRPAEVTRLRRAALLAGCAAVPLLAAVFVMFGVRTMQSWSQKSPGLLELNQVLQIRSQARFWHRSRMPSDEQFAAYIATKFSSVVTNTQSWNHGLAATLIKGEARDFAEDSLTVAAGMNDEQRQQAVQAVQLFLPGTSMTDYLNQPWLPSFVAASSLAFYVAVPAIIAALLFRGGLAQRLAGIAFVRKQGAPASRLQLLWRSLVTWSIIPLGFVVFGLWREPIGPVAASTLGWLVVSVLTAISVLLPNRSLQDRLAGTWPVPR